jgi:hypothetical protein
MLTNACHEVGMILKYDDDEGDRFHLPWMTIVRRTSIATVFFTVFVFATKLVLIKFGFVVILCVSSAQMHL